MAEEIVYAFLITDEAEGEEIHFSTKMELNGEGNLFYVNISNGSML